jgi:DNA-binding response OmpR family regulator
LRRFAYLGDDSDFTKSIREGLESLGISTIGFSGSSEIEGISRDNPEAIVLVDPYFHLSRTVRKSMEDIGGRFSNLPLIAVFRNEESVADLGNLKYLDDFVIFPGGAEEVVVRVEFHGLKRGGKGNVIIHGDLVINLEAHQVFVDGKPIDLTLKEYELLKTLAATPGRVYSREALLRSIWGYDYLGGTRTVDVHIRRVRSKVERKRKYIETVHGVGYRFVS